MVEGDLDAPGTLGPALEGAYGVFLVTNFWAHADELAQGKAAVAAAKKAGVRHFVWSTLPNVEAIAFAHPDRAGHGEHLALAGDTKSWNEVVEILRGQGWNVGVRQVPAEAYDGSYPGAEEMRHMMQYFEAHTYFGPDAEQKIARAREVATAPATPLAEWARAHLDPPT